MVLTNRKLKQKLSERELWRYDFT